MSDKLNNSDALDRAWRYYQHADNLLAGRINFFLVAESMLIVSFMTLDIEFCLRFSITILGLFYTGGWFVVNIGLLKRMEFLKKKLETLDPIYKYYMEVVHWGWAKRLCQMNFFVLKVGKNPYMVPIFFSFCGFSTLKVGKKH